MDDENSGSAEFWGVKKRIAAIAPRDEQQLREIESRTAKCEEQNDVSKMSLFADDFVVSGKKVLSKQQVEEAVKNNLVAHGNAPSPHTIEEKKYASLFIRWHRCRHLQEYRQTPDTTKFFDEDDTDVFKRGPRGWLARFSKIFPAVMTPAG